MAFSFNKKTKKKGFTLIELLIVVAIMAILTAVIAFISSVLIDRARVARAQGDLNRIAKAIKTLELDTGLYPSKDPGDNCGFAGGATNEITLYPGEARFNESGIVTNFNTGPVSNWKGPYMEDRDFTKDPWGNYYWYDGDYNCTELVKGCEDFSDGNTNEKVVTSWGRNGIQYDDDDIVIVFCSR